MQKKQVIEYCNKNSMPHLEADNVLHVFVPIGQAVGSKPMPHNLNGMDFNPQMFYQLVAIDMKHPIDTPGIKRQEQWQAIHQAGAIPHIITTTSTKAIKFIERCQEHYAYKPAGGIHQAARTCTLPKPAA